MHYTEKPFAIDADNTVQTHCSLVLLKDDKVFKLKKNIKFPFLDYSTLELRRQFCLEEVKLNRRFSPAIYLGVCDVREQDGKLVFGEVSDNPPECSDEIVDFAVVMKRIPDGQWLSDKVAANELETDQIVGLMKRLVETYNREGATDEIKDNGRPESLKFNTVANIAECEQFVGQCLSREAWERLDAFLRGWFEENHELFDQRVDSDRIRDGHGDLKPTNVAFEGDTPLITDCIEFNPLFRRLDTLCEICFLATGLESLGAFGLAQNTLRAYREIAEDMYPDMLRRYYQCHLACVMGKVTSLQLLDPNIDDEHKQSAIALAKHYFALADFHVREPHAVAISGIMGCGKSTVADELEKLTGWPHYNSDVVRKQVFGIDPLEKLPPQAYTDEVSAKVYDHLISASGMLERGGFMDAQWPRHGTRKMLKETMAAKNGQLLFVHCDAPDDVVKARMDERAKGESVSDATSDLLESARDGYEPISDDEGLRVIEIDTTKSADENARLVLKELLGPEFNPSLA
ncbi:MAG: bifunctional aminoglycoside phosphotransferase/ATP-binding protein [Planctomycetota bacterium]|jgi:aminoglycoside phosphotransferase family enzyme/gluconate kinase